MTFVDSTRAVVEQMLVDSRGSALEGDAERISRQFGEPLRVAIAGRVKAGKSTLLNALVRDRLAATDAGECTTIVTEYRHSHSYDVHGIDTDGLAVELTASRDDGLTITIPDGVRQSLERIVVAWPSTTLQGVTYIDTPGLVSINERHSALTASLLTPDDGSVTEADAVLYLLRHVHERDVAFLGSFMDRGTTLGTPLNAIGLLSRSDEIGAGRLDAMESAGRIAARLGRDDRLRGLVSGVVPVAALLAETAATITEAELANLRRAASELGGDQGRYLVSVDRFSDTPDSSLGRDERRRLLARLGLFGVRLCVDELTRNPLLSGSELVARLDAASGVGAVRAQIETTFLPRADLLKARSALAGARRLAYRLATIDGAASQRLLADVDRIESAALDFVRFRVLHLLASGATAGSQDATRRAQRAALEGDTITRAEALDAIEELRVELENPLLSGPGAELVQLTLRLHEARASAS
jgi:hypothetical protein